MRVRLVDLPDMHPCLLWDDILAATVAVLERRVSRGPHPFLLEFEDIPGYGSGQADYVVDDERHLLEVAGRSRRSDLQSAWDARWRRLARRPGSGFYVFVAEFEIPTGRLGFGT